METTTTNVAIIGMGNMGHAIAEQLQDDIYSVTGISRGDDWRALQTADISILAVKPQSFTDELARDVRTHVNEHGLVVSIMAGVQLRHLRESLGTERVIRTMPNLALRSGESLTAWFAEKGMLSEEDEAIVEKMLGQWGTYIRLGNESLFDAFTALAGSGPAYFYELAAALETEAIGYGFSAEQARLIGTQVLHGAASIVTSNTSTAELADRVTSKGGTTRAARDVFKRMGFRRIIRAAVVAATKRSRELGKH